MKQTKLLFFVICSLISVTAISQKKEDVIGTWKIKQILVPEELQNNKPVMQKLEQAMLQSRFQFNRDGSCSVTPDKKMQFKKCKWSFNEKDKTISIEGEMDGERGLLMGIIVSFKNNKWYFALSETTVILEVQKMPA